MIYLGRESEFDRHSLTASGMHSRLLLLSILGCFFSQFQEASPPPTLPPWSAFEFLHELKAVYEGHPNTFYTWGPLELVDLTFRKKMEEKDKAKFSDRNLFREKWGVPSLG